MPKLIRSGALVPEELDSVVNAQQWIPPGFEWEDHTPCQRFERWFLSSMRLPSSHKVVVTDNVFDGADCWTVIVGPKYMLYKAYRWRYESVITNEVLPSGNVVIVCKPGPIALLPWKFPVHVYTMDPKIDRHVYPMLGIHRKTLQVVIQQPLRDVWEKATKSHHSPYLFLRSNIVGEISKLLEKLLHQTSQTSKYRIMLKHWETPLLHPSVIAHFLQTSEPCYAFLPPIDALCGGHGHAESGTD